VTAVVSCALPCVGENCDFMVTLNILHKLLYGNDMGVTNTSSASFPMYSNQLKLVLTFDFHTNRATNIFLSCGDICRTCLRLAAFFFKRMGI
jgi:hypothetical protein